MKHAIYENDIKHLYHSQNLFSLAPHLYTLAERAYRQMRESQTFSLKKDDKSKKKNKLSKLKNKFQFLQEDSNKKDVSIKRNGEGLFFFLNFIEKFFFKFK